MPAEREWRIEFYRDRRGRSPVEEFIRKLDANTRGKVGRAITLLERQGDRLGMPLTRRVVGYRFSELRVQYGRTNVRVFYYILMERRIILLHAFMKKSQRTPMRELDIAARRLGDVIGG